MCQRAVDGAVEPKVTDWREDGSEHVHDTPATLIIVTVTIMITSQQNTIMIIVTLTIMITSQQNTIMITSQQNTIMITT